MEKKMWYIYTMEYYSAVKRKDMGSFIEIWMDLESVIQNEVNKKNDLSYINTYVWNIKDSTSQCTQSCLTLLQPHGL